MVGLVDGHANVEGREHGEHKGLDVGDQALQHADEHAEDHRDYRYTGTHSHGDGVADDEDDDHKAKYDDMSSRHIGK